MPIDGRAWLAKTTSLCSSAVAASLAGDTRFSGTSAIPCVPFWIKVQTEEHWSHSQKYSTRRGGFRSPGTVSPGRPGFVPDCVSTRNSLPSRSRRNGFEHCGFAQWLSMSCLFPAGSRGFDCKRTRKAVRLPQRACMRDANHSEAVLFRFAQFPALPRILSCADPSATAEVSSSGLPANPESRVASTEPRSTSANHRPGNRNDHSYHA